MGKCECGAETDWQEIGSTWVCVSCRSDEIAKSIGELKEGFKIIEQATLGLHRLKVDTHSMTGQLDHLKSVISTIEASNK